MDRKRILIAVNTPAEIEKLRRMLVSSGYEVKVSDNGMAALSLSRSFRPHLILSELNLRKIDGHHFLREVKSNSATNTIPFVLMSRHRSVDERVHSINLGADDYITLPLDMREIVLRFETIMNEMAHIENVTQSQTKGFTGKLSDMNLLELLQALEIGKKSCVVRLQNGDDEGIVFLKDGQVVDAALYDLTQEHALFRMFTWSEGSFRVEIRPVEQRGDIERTTDELLSKGMAYRERWDQVRQHLPSLETRVTLADNSNGNLSHDEQTLINLINGSTRMVDMVTQSDLDDLSALQLLASLYKKGALTEAPVSEDDRDETVPRANGQSNGSNVANLIANFLAPQSTRLTERKRERRRADRRRNQDRRARNRRWDDFIAEKNCIFLNKSELIMIREKLANGERK